jgi:hypothetical protein
VNNTGTKKVSVTKLHSILKRKEGDIAPCLKNVVFIFVE